MHTTQNYVHINMCPIKRESNSINWIITEMKDEKENWKKNTAYKAKRKNKH